MEKTAQKKFCSEGTKAEMSMQGSSNGWHLGWKHTDIDSASIIKHLSDPATTSHLPRLWGISCLLTGDTEIMLPCDTKYSSHLTHDPSIRCCPTRETKKTRYTLSVSPLRFQPNSTTMSSSLWQEEEELPLTGWNLGADPGSGDSEPSAATQREIQKYLWLSDHG